MTKTVKPLPITFITGGDIIWHRAQLFIANWVRILMIFGFTLALSWYLLVLTFVSEWGRHVFIKTQIARLLKTLFVHGYQLKLTTETGETLRMSAGNLARFVQETPSLTEVVSRVFWLGGIAALVALVASGIAVYLNIRYGKKAQEDEFIRGQKECTPEQLDEQIRNSVELENAEIDEQNRIIEEENRKIDDPTKRIKPISHRKMSPIHIGDVHFSIEMLFQNILILGGMGSGKSVLFNSLFGQFRQWGKKQITFDIKGEFTALWYREGIDVILSVVDARSALWTIFNDLREVTDVAKLSTFFVPKTKKAEEDIWGDLARMLLEDLITIVRTQGGTMKDVADIITQYSLDDLAQLLKDNNARSSGSINPENPKGAESVRLTLTGQPAIRFFQFFDDKTANYSLRDFIHQEGDACLFLNSSELHHEACRPFISAWIQLAILEAMSMGPCSDVRMVVNLDEMDSLGNMDLDPLFTRARSYGVVTIVGLLNKSQPDHTFGEEKTRTYFSNWQNKFIMRCPEPQSAKYLSDTLGKEDIKEQQESQSFGIESSRDGTSLSQKRGEVALVTDTDIMKLPKYVGYLKVAGDFPITKIRHRYTPRLQISESLVRRSGLDLEDIEKEVVLNSGSEVDSTPEIEQVQVNQESTKPDSIFNPW